MSGQARVGNRPTPTASGQPTEPMTLELLGLVMIPNVVERTPPFVDQVIPGSAAEKAGLRKDDLIVQAGGQVTASLRDFHEQLAKIDRDSVMHVMIQRGSDFLDIRLQVTGR